MTEAYNQGSKSLFSLCIDDHVRVQNQTPIRTTKWDKTGVITAVLGTRKYEIAITDLDLVGNLDHLTVVRNFAVADLNLVVGLDNLAVVDLNLLEILDELQDMRSAGNVEVLCLHTGNSS